MQPRTPKLLEDIRDAAAFVIDSMSGCTLERFEENRLLRQAVERNYEIIGEALNRIARSDPDTAERIGDTPRIVAFRNLLAHGYDMIDHEIVWSITRDNLPELLARVESLLGEV